MVVWEADKVIRKVRKAAKTRGAKRLAELIAFNAKRLCPVGEFERTTRPGQLWAAGKPGDLRDSIRVEPARYDDAYLVSAGGYNTYYVKWVELGAPARSAEQWRKHGHEFPVPRQPFLRPAAMKSKNSGLAYFGNIL